MNVLSSYPTLAAALQAAALVQVLQSTPFTIFAPTEAAFAKLPAGAVQSLLNDPTALANVLKYHAVPGKYTLADLPAFVKTANGQDIAVTRDEKGVVYLNQNSKVMEPAMSWGPSVVYPIDMVLMPPILPSGRSVRADVVLPGGTQVYVGKPMSYAWLWWLLIIVLIVIAVWYWVKESRKSKGMAY